LASRSRIYALIDKEVKDKLRSKWLVVSTWAFILFGIGIAYLGVVPVGVVGLQEFDATLMSLVNLSIYLIPLMALSLGSGSIVDEKERGNLDLIFSTRITKGEFLAGKSLGLSLTLSLALLMGLGLVGVLIGWKVGTKAIGNYLLFLFSSVLLGIIFVNIAILSSIVFKEKGRVTAAVGLLWLFYAFLYDLILIGILIASKGHIPPSLFAALLFLNPSDLYRMVNLWFLDKANILLGMASIPIFSNPYWAIGMFILWVFIPILFSYLFFRRKLSS
jgi:Cu-processing system permease protein